MLVIRPVKSSDLKQLVELSTRAPAGLTTLPNDPKLLERRTKEAVRSFAELPDRPGHEVFLFVMEDLQQKRVVGTTAIFSKVGGYQPFYTYKIKTVTKESKLLNVKKDLQYLQLVVDHNGPSELGTLFLAPEYRKDGNGRLLSLSRFLFIAQYRPCFEDRILAELRGVIDKNGRSPFWESLGKHFFMVEFQKADLMVMRDKTFIAELMPEHPVYIPLLAPEAQDAIAQVNEDTKPALWMLEREGFTFKDEIDIFEAGPVVSAPVDEIRSVKESRAATVKNISDGPLDSESFLIANIDDFSTFRAVQGKVHVDQEGVTLPRVVAEALQVKEGSRIRFVASRAKNVQ